MVKTNTSTYSKYIAKQVIIVLHFKNIFLTNITKYLFFINTILKNITKSTIFLFFLI